MNWMSFNLNLTVAFIWLLQNSFHCLFFDGIYYYLTFFQVLIDFPASKKIAFLLGKKRLLQILDQLKRFLRHHVQMFRHWILKFNMEYLWYYSNYKLEASQGFSVILQDSSDLLRNLLVNSNKEILSDSPKRILWDF